MTHQFTRQERYDVVWRDLELPPFGGHSIVYGAKTPERSLLWGRRTRRCTRVLREAVRLIEESGKPLATIAKDLGISEPTLRSWRKQADLDSGKRSDGPTTEERDEVRRSAP